MVDLFIFYEEYVWIITQYQGETNYMYKPSELARIFLGG